MLLSIPSTLAIQLHDSSPPYPFSQTIFPSLRPGKLSNLEIRASPVPSRRLDCIIAQGGHRHRKSLGRGLRA